jgi:ferredoxin
MSRFGLRNKLKQMLGQQKREIIRHRVTYILPDGTEQTVEAEERYNLLMASQALPSPIGTGRRAGGSCVDGGCGSCRVEVLDATGLTPMTEAEKATLDAYVAGEPHEGRCREPGEPYTEFTRLGCYAKIVGSGARVEVSELVDFEALQGEKNGF